MKQDGGETLLVVHGTYQLYLGHRLGALPETPLDYEYINLALFLKIARVVL